ncbi:MAG TPA: response regulator [Verrucomicrobiae bacterium]|nr:response regulator [Verrucomicrobiae bacterium]
MIIDDEADLAWMLKLNLERTRLYEVGIEADPQRAVAAAREFAPDLVLLDLILPSTSGGELAAQIKTAFAPATLPVIFLTAALPRPQSTGTPRTMAGYRFLSKPVGLDELLECIAAELPHRRAA